MRASFGNGGWVAIDGADLPGPLYVRVQDVDGRLRISEFYLDASAGPQGIEHADFSAFPLRQIEAHINYNADQVRARIDLASPDLSVLASHYSTSFGNVERQLAEGNWVVASFVAQQLPPGHQRGAIKRGATVGEPSLFTGEDLESAGPDALPVLKVSRSSHKWKNIREAEKSYRIASGPDDGLTDDFLRDVARAYAAAVARGERPNRAIVDQLGGHYPLRTVQRWVYTARQRGIMPRGTKGVAG